MTTASWQQEDYTLMKVLYLTEWYPHRYDAMPGLFVRKHAAAAVRQGAEVCVLYFLKDENACTLEIEEQTTDGIREIYVYYHCHFLKAMKNGWKEVQKRWGAPDLVQLNVLTKNGLLAYFLKRTRHIPYIIVEHWSGYLPENNSFRGGLHGRLMKHIARNASAILPVSEALEKAMKQCGISNGRWERVHNVVDDFFYEEKPTENSGKFRFLHVSCFDERSKNIRGILDAAKLLSEQRADFEMHIVGNGPDFEADKEYADKLGLTDKTVFFKGEKTPEEVHEAMLQSQCFVLFSRFENAPVVLSESMATGLPIIATRAGGMPEMVNERNGLLVESGNVEQLAEAMDRMIGEASHYDRNTLREMGKIYSEEAVGKQLCSVYRAVAAN